MRNPHPQPLTKDYRGRLSSTCPSKSLCSARFSGNIPSSVGGDIFAEMYRNVLHSCKDVSLSKFPKRGHCLGGKSDMIPWSQYKGSHSHTINSSIIIDTWRGRLRYRFFLHAQELLALALEARRPHNCNELTSERSIFIYMDVFLFVSPANM